MAATTSIRVSRETHEKLKEIAEKEQRSLGDVLDAAIAQYRERQFWQDAREAYTRLREDPEAWQAYRDELAEWDATLMDGLGAEEPYDEDLADAS